jgi:hypothetical protein
MKDRKKTESTRKRVRLPFKPVFDLDREAYKNTRAEVLTGYSDAWGACVELGYWVAE